jgi:predicted ester cyclase
VSGGVGGLLRTSGDRGAPVAEGEPTQLVHQLVDGFNRGSVDAVAHLLHPQVMDHHLPDGTAPGIDGIRRWWDLLHAAFDLHVDIDDVIEGADRVATRMTVYASHVGTFLGHPPTGRACVLPVLTIERFDGGQLVERWQVGDTLRASRRLGLPTSSVPGSTRR